MHQIATRYSRLSEPCESDPMRPVFPVERGSGIDSLWPGKSQYYDEGIKENKTHFETWPIYPPTSAVIWVCYALSTDGETKWRVLGTAHGGWPCLFNRTLLGTRAANSNITLLVDRIAYNKSPIWLWPISCRISGTSIAWQLHCPGPPSGERDLLQQPGAVYCPQRYQRLYSIFE